MRPSDSNKIFNVALHIKSLSTPDFSGILLGRFDLQHKYTPFSKKRRQPHISNSVES